jgi:hypothetical protein
MLVTHCNNDILSVYLLVHLPSHTWGPASALMVHQASSPRDLNKQNYLFTMFQCNSQILTMTFLGCTYLFVSLLTLGAQLRPSWSIRLQALGSWPNKFNCLHEVSMWVTNCDNNIVVCTYLFVFLLTLGAQPRPSWSIRPEALGSWTDNIDSQHNASM